MLHINTDERKKTKNNVKLEIVVKQTSKLPKNSTILSIPQLVCWLKPTDYDIMSG